MCMGEKKGGWERLGIQEILRERREEKLWTGYNI